MTDPGPAGNKNKEIFSDLGLRSQYPVKFERLKSFEKFMLRISLIFSDLGLEDECFR